MLCVMLISCERENSIILWLTTKQTRSSIDCSRFSKKILRVDASKIVLKPTKFSQSLMSAREERSVICH